MTGRDVDDPDALRNQRIQQAALAETLELVHSLEQERDRLASAFLDIHEHVLAEFNNPDYGQQVLSTSIRELEKIDQMLHVARSTVTTLANPLADQDRLNRSDS